MKITVSPETYLRLTERLDRNERSDEVINEWLVWQGLHPEEFKYKATEIEVVWQWSVVDSQVCSMVAW
jgi:hypothetical protein